MGGRFCAVGLAFGLVSGMITGGAVLAQDAAQAQSQAQPQAPAQTQSQAPAAVPASAGELTAQERTMADIKQDISVLYVELQRLKRELSTTEGPGPIVPGGPLARIAEIETALGRMIGKIERLEFRIETLVRDGTNRLALLDLRLCEIEPDCDLDTLDVTARLGGSSVDPAPAPAQPFGLGTDRVPLEEGALAISEEDDFLTAQKALDEGAFASAAEQFALFREIYPGSPLEAPALLGEGRALSEIGDTREAARRFLGVFSDYTTSPQAPESLWRLALSLNTLGSRAEACVALGEVVNRYPASDFVIPAQESQRDLDCQ